MHITPDTIVIFEWGFIRLNATIIFTWVIMGLWMLLSWLATRHLSVESGISRWQNFLEIIVGYMRGQIQEVAPGRPDRYLAFLGTLFLFISLSNFLAFIPGYYPPTGSLSTTAALAMCVFFAVPIYGIRQIGFSKYLKHYMQPTMIMLPFNIIGEFTRTLALAVRLFGNVMSGTLIGGVLIVVVPLFVPVIMQLFSLLIGQIHAYIFAILALVYIASSAQVSEEELIRKEGT